MPSENQVYIGIDPTAGKYRLLYAVLDSRLGLVRLDSGEVGEIAAFAGSQERALAAVCGPPAPNRGLMKQEDFRAALDPSPRPGTWEDFRVAEYLLALQKIRLPRTPAQKPDCPLWMRTGFEVHAALAEAGFSPFPAEDAPRLVIETNPYAVYTTLLGCLPFPKTSLEGRLQRQLKLYDLGLDIPDPMRVFEEITRHRIMQGMLPLEGLHTPHELAALAAAYTAWTAGTKPGGISLIGDPREGQILLPLKGLKNAYH